MNSSGDADTDKEESINKSKKKKKTTKKFKEDAYIFKKSLDLQRGRKKLLSTVNRQPQPFRSLDATLDRRRTMEKKAKSLTRSISHLLAETERGEDSDDEDDTF
eukprot:TRINITY_DN1564_c0_g1_i2.p1 TRINITY_DN1564_c0_g1~~TRINITY_DN1564_c0_g1_i2.p1  ORF type:complete len:104 (-),score=39.18 TRINITY_DN1564_c0_g1_i2:86-397(-)